MLAEVIVARLARESGRPDIGLTAEAIASLSRYEWPGNLRELRNVLERALLLSRDNVIQAEDLQFEPPRFGALAPGAPRGANGTALALEEVERRHILTILESCHGNVQEASAILGVPRSTLYQKLKRFGVRLNGRSTARGPEWSTAEEPQEV